MKKKLLIIIPVLLIICSISFYRIYLSTLKNFDNLLGTNESKITKVFMRNGMNGSYVETNDKEKIKELITLLNNRDYKKSLNQEFRSGYSYFYDFYSESKQLVRITGDGDTVEVNGTYYNVSKPISVDLLTNWFNSLPVNASNK